MRIAAAIVLVPALASVLGLALARRMPSAAIGAGWVSAFVTVVLALWLSVIDSTPGWLAYTSALEAGEIAIPLILRTDAPVPVILLVVALVGLCVQLYAAWYLADDDRRGVFSSTVSLFVAAMLLLVASDDLVLTLVGWEVMGWCSYLLIGHWSRREEPRRAAHKAFLVTRFADIGFVLGVVLLSVGAGTTSLSGVLSGWAAVVDCPDTAACAAPDGTIRAVALVLLVIGVLGKSAQFPFQDWLPDAMEGPTPASALIHAATMVAAGTFVLAQVSPLLAVSSPGRWVLAVSVAVTMVLAAVTAFVQTDLKRMLAWSTVSQVGVMLAAIAGGVTDSAAGAGVLHLFAHAFFKALLFLVIGWLAVVAGGTAVARLRGSARTLPFARIAFGFGLLALAGFPFVVGGTSKERVVESVLHAARDGRPESVLVLVALLVTVVLTAAYATRAWLVVSAPEEAVVPPLQTSRPNTEKTSLYSVEISGDPIKQPAPDHAHTGPNAGALAAVGLLLAGTVLGSLVLATDLIPDTGETSVWLLLGTVLLIGLGAAIAWGLRDRALRAPFLESGLGFDGLYRRLVATPVLALARLVAATDDRVVDATARGSARLVTLAGVRGSADHEAERPATGMAWVLGAAALLALVGVVAWR